MFFISMVSFQVCFFILIAGRLRPQMQGLCLQRKERRQGKQRLSLSFIVNISQKLFRSQHWLINFSLRSQYLVHNLLCDHNNGIKSSSKLLLLSFKEHLVCGCFKKQVTYFLHSTLLIVRLQGYTEDGIVLIITSKSFANFSAHQGFWYRVDMVTSQQLLPLGQPTNFVLSSHKGIKNVALIMAARPIIQICHNPLIFFFDDHTKIK